MRDHEIENALTKARRELEDKKRALELAEAQIREQRKITTDLLSLLGTKETCSKCNAPTFWVRPRGSGSALLNPDGHGALAVPQARPHLGESA